MSSNSMADFYVVRMQVHESEAPSRLHVLVRVSEEGLEHVRGDQVISSLLELEDGKPKVSERALCTYDIIPLEKESSYRFYEAVRDGRARDWGDGEYSWTDFETKTIFAGKI